MYLMHLILGSLVPNENNDKQKFEENKNGQVESISDISDASDRRQLQLGSSTAVSTNGSTKPETIYRIGRSDNFGCKNCKVRGDRFFMEAHVCRAQ